MAQQESKLPAGENLSRPMIAFLQMIESRFPSDASHVDSGATLAELIARFNTLLDDLNKR